MINPHPTRRVDDAICLEQDGHVINLFFFVLEEYQVAGLSFADCGEVLSLIRLLPTVAEQLVSTDFEYHLSESRTVNSEWAFASPQVRRVVILKGYTAEILVLAFLSEVFSLAIKRKLFLHLEQFKARDGNH